MYQRVFFGKVTQPVNLTLADISKREQAVIWPLAVAALVMGVAPYLFLHSIEPSVQAVIQAASKVVPSVTSTLLGGQ